jgi:hypothetical protein
MQALRDAFALLVVILIVATVRVTPVPKIELSPAQAKPASNFEIQTDPIAPDPAVVSPDEAGDDTKRACAQALTARSKSPKCPGSSVPCDV